MQIYAIYINADRGKGYCRLLHFSQNDGNDRMDYICDEDIGHVEKPWSDVLAVLMQFKG